MSSIVVILYIFIILVIRIITGMTKIRQNVLGLVGIASRDSRQAVWRERGAEAPSTVKLPPIGRPACPQIRSCCLAGRRAQKP